MDPYGPRCRLINIVNSIMLSWLKVLELFDLSQHAADGTIKEAVMVPRIRKLDFV